MGSLLDTAKRIASRQKASVSEHELNEKNEISPREPGSSRRGYAERVLSWRRAGYGDEAARQMAWSAIAADWYRKHGERTPPEICAGCGEVLGDDTAVLLLPHGERAHAAGDDECIVMYGRRWKAAAAAALASWGISTPDGIAAELAEKREDPAGPAASGSTGCREDDKR